MLCIDEKTGRLLHAFELGLLSDEELTAFEEHLIACEHCRRNAAAFHDATSLLRVDPDVINASRQALGEKSIQEIQSRKKTVSSRPWRKIPWAVAAVLALLLLKDWTLDFSPSQEVVASPNLMAVMYFEDITDPADSLRWGEITSDLLITDLSESKYLSVLSSHRMYDILKQLGREHARSINKETASEVAAAGRAHWILTGRVLQHSPNIIITSQLSDAVSGTVIAAQKVIGGADESIFDVIDRLTIQLKADLALPREAVQEYDPLVENKTTKSIETYRLFVVASEQLRRGNWVDARDLFEQVVRMDTSFAMAWYYLAKSRHDDQVGQIEALDHALANIDRATRVQQLYIRAATTGDINERARLYKKITDEYPQEKEAYISLGATYEDLNDRPNAIAMYSAVLELDSTYIRGYRSLAYLYDQLLQHDSALAMAERMVATDPEDPLPYHVKATMLAHSGHPYRAIDWYQKALEIDPDYPYSLDRLSSLYLLVGDFDRADSVYSATADSKNPDHHYWGQFRRSQIPRREGRIQDAITILSDLIKRVRSEVGFNNPAGRAIFDRSGLYGFFTDKYDSAMADALEIIDIARDAGLENWSGRLHGLGNAMVIAQYWGDSATADSLLGELDAVIAARGVPSDDIAYFWHGQYEYYRGNYEAAVEYQEKVAEFAVTFTSLQELARAYYGAGRIKDAIEMYEAALNWYSIERADYSEFAVCAVYELGLAYDDAGRRIDAIEKYEQFLEMWKNADPGIRQVGEARRRLRKLKRQP